VLAAVLLVAAVAKLADAADARHQMTMLLGAAVGHPVARALPVAEIAIAVSLVAWWSAIPAVVAASVLVVFTAVLVVAEVRRLPCACFGAASSRGPVGPLAVVRNAVLVALAVLGAARIEDPSAAGVLVGVVVFGVPTALVILAAR
jgi:hypothetical protein